MANKFGHTEADKRERFIRQIEVCILYAALGSIKRVSHVAGITPPTIRKYLRQWNVKIRRNNDKTRFGKKENHWKWNGGVARSGSGYVMIRVGKHKYKPEHVLIMEKKTGRGLEKGEVVHHINGIRDDNRPENLALMTNSSHNRLHATGKRHTEKTKVLMRRIKNGTNQKEEHNQWRSDITAEKIVDAAKMFKTKKMAAEYLGISVDAMRTRAKYYNLFKDKKWVI